MTKRVMPFILATAGHVDHGKSALVRALTGTDPDRLPEEKARGLTIQLGFASLDLACPAAPQKIFRLGMVDVPGHEDFVKNMIAGIGSIDMALLVVAADDGWMPQTEEHLQILAYLGVRHGAVALTKADLVADVDAASREVADRLVGTFLANAPIVPVSVVDGRGLDKLQATLASLLSEQPARREGDKPRLPLDRVFSLPGSGTIATGTLTGGPLHRGQTVMIQPGAITTRIRGIECYGEPVTTAPSGSRVALNLVGVRPGDAKNPEAKTVHRGQTVVLPGLVRPTDTLTVVLSRMNRRIAASEIPRNRQPTVHHAARIYVHHGSAATPGRVYLMGTGKLGPGEHCLAQLRLDRPLATFGGDRLVLRDSSCRYTIAGGTVVDPVSDRRRWKQQTYRDALAMRAASLHSPTAWLRSELAYFRVVLQNDLLVQTQFHTDTINEAVAELKRDGAIVSANAFLVDAAHLKDLCREAAHVIGDFHRRHPERVGLPVTELRTRLDMPADERASAELWGAIIATLCNDDYRQRDAVICHAAHRPQLPPRLAPAGERLRQVLGVDPLNPPSRPQLAPDAVSEQALRFLVINGEVTELTPECVIAERALCWASEQIRAFIAVHGPASVSHLKRHLGSSRRVMVPLLEYLDRAGITRRQGDQRVLGASVSREPTAKLHLHSSAPRLHHGPSESLTSPGTRVAESEARVGGNFIARPQHPVVRRRDESSASTIKPRSGSSS